MKVRTNIPPFLRVSRGELALQVGTPNVSTMRMLSTAVGAEGRVVIVEPAPSNVDRLSEARSELRWNNVELVRCAAWSEPGEVTLSLAAHDGDHKIDVEGIEHDNDYRPENTYDEGIEVSARTLDQIVQSRDLPTVNYLEVMVNGAELEVLHGADSLLESDRPIRVLVKGHARRTEDRRPLNREIAEVLEKRGLKANILPAGDPATGSNPDWESRDGDVFAYAA